MSLFDDLKRGISVMLSPWENTKKSTDIGATYSMYYKTTVVPVVVYILVSLLLVSVASSIFAFRQVFAPLIGLGWVSAIAIPVAIVWVLIPISIFIEAAILHVVGRATGKFRGGFEKTLAAMAYSAFPKSIFSFMLAIPFALPTYILLSFWGILVGIVSLANQQKISWVMALGIEVIAFALTIAAVGFIASMFAVSLGATAMHWLITHQMAAATV